MARFKKGSAEAKAYMTKLREMVGKRRKTLKTSSPPKESRKTPRMARRYGRYRARRRRGGLTIPIAPILGLAAGLVEPVGFAFAGDYERAFKHLTESYTGWSPENNKWVPGLMMRGLAPLVAGLLVHKFVGGAPLNLNSMLARSKVPFIRI